MGETGVGYILGKLGILKIWAWLMALPVIVELNAYFHTESGAHVANHLPFITLTVRDMKSPLTTRLIESAIMAGGVFLFMQVFTIPEIKNDIAKVGQHIDKIDDKMDSQSEELSRIKERLARIEK